MCKYAAIVMWACAAAINQDGTVNSSAHPTPDGTYVSIWATGTGYLPGADGQVATGANQNCSTQLVLCNVAESGGFPGAPEPPAYVSYSRAAPGFLSGVEQISK